MDEVFGTHRPDAILITAAATGLPVLAAMGSAPARPNRAKVTCYGTKLALRTVKISL